MPVCSRLTHPPAERPLNAAVECCEDDCIAHGLGLWRAQSHSGLTHGEYACAWREGMLCSFLPTVDFAALFGQLLAPLALLFPSYVLLRIRPSWPSVSSLPGHHHQESASHPVGSPPNCLDKRLPAWEWRLRGLYANIRGPHQDKSDRVVVSITAPSRRVHGSQVRTARSVTVVATGPAVVVPHTTGSPANPPPLPTPSHT